MLRLSGERPEGGGVRLIVVKIAVFNGNMHVRGNADFAGEPLESWLARRHDLVDERNSRLRASGR
jgi:hypothetical protein